MKVVSIVILLLTVVSNVYAASMLLDVCERTEVSVSTGTELWILSKTDLVDDKGARLKTVFEYEIKSSNVFGSSILTVITPLYESEFTATSNDCNIKIIVIDTEKRKQEFQTGEKLKECLLEKDMISELLVEETRNATRLDNTITKLSIEKIDLVKQVRALNDTIETNQTRYVDKFVMLNDQESMSMFWDTMIQSVGAYRVVKSYWELFAIVGIVGASGVVVYKRKKVSSE